MAGFEIFFIYIPLFYAKIKLLYGFICALTSHNHAIPPPPPHPQMYLALTNAATIAYLANHIWLA
jgi:hypothetical protein